MKKLLLISLLLGIVFHSSSGQNEKPITKGHLLTGGSLSLNVEKTKDYSPITGTNPRQIYITDSKTLETDLYIGYYIINHMALGFKTDIIISSEIHSFNLNTLTSKYKNHDISFEPFIRYSTTSGLFFEGTVGVGLLKFDNSGSDVAKWKNYSFSTGIGYSLFISESIAVEPEIKYKYMHTPPYEIDVDNVITSGVYFAIGFQIYLSTKKENSNKD
jgi:opacity protein-like surface antigen